MHSFLNAYLRGALSLAFILVGVQARALMCSQVFQNAPLAFHSQLDSQAAAEKAAAIFLQMIGNENIPLGEAIEHSRHSLRINSGISLGEGISNSLNLINNGNPKIEAVFTRVKTLQTHLSDLRTQIAEHKSEKTSLLSSLLRRKNKIQDDRLMAINNLFNAIKSDVTFLNSNRSVLEEQQQEIQQSFKNVNAYLARVRLYTESVNQFNSSVYQIMDSTSASSSQRLQQVLPSLKMEFDSALVELMKTETIKSQLEARHLESKLALDLLDFSRVQSLESLMAETAYTPDHVKVLLEKRLPELKEAQTRAEEKVQKKAQWLKRMKQAPITLFTIGMFMAPIGIPVGLIASQSMNQEAAQNQRYLLATEANHVRYPENLVVSSRSKMLLEKIQPTSTELSDFFNQKPGYVATSDFLAEWFQGRSSVTPEDALYLFYRLPTTLNLDKNEYKKMQAELQFPKTQVFKIEDGLFEDRFDVTLAVQMKILELTLTQKLTEDQAFTLSELIRDRFDTIRQISEYLTPEQLAEMDASLKKSYVRFKNSKK